jgi:hypothetical protein
MELIRRLVIIEMTSTRTAAMEKRNTAKLLYNSLLRVMFLPFLSILDEIYGFVYAAKLLLVPAALFW